jgi:hypothetical protein
MEGAALSALKAWETTALCPSRLICSTSRVTSALAITLQRFNEPNGRGKRSPKRNGD